MTVDKITKKQHGRRIYLLPNLLTTAGLFAAFYAIVAAMQAKFEIAAIAILIAMIADALDGRVARLTGTQSSFGTEYDSLADMVSFGVAPALLAYQWSLTYLGKFGWLAAFIYTAAAALRLARFNIHTTESDKRYFQGLACPCAAGVIVTFIWFCQVQSINGTALNIFTALLTIVLGALMVSNIRYYSFKDMDFKKSLPSIVGLLIVLLFVSISIDPPSVLLLGFGLYALSGPVYMLIFLHKIKRAKKNEQKTNR